MMGTYSVWHEFIFLLAIATIIVPMTKILQKAGFSGWLVVLWLIPLVNIGFLWWFAFTKWPERNAGTHI